MVDIYSNIYHLHIPRTAGVFLRNSILKEIKSDSCFVGHGSILNLNNINSYNFISGHFGTSPIINNQFVFSIIRNPVDRFISYYSYTKKILKEDFLDRWLFDEEYYRTFQNTQIKFLTNGIDVDRYNLNLVNSETIKNNWFIGQNDNLDDAIKFVDSNFILTIENVDVLLNHLQINKFYDKMNESNQIELPEKYNKRILYLNEKDMELYQYVRSKKF